MKSSVIKDVLNNGADLIIEFHGGKCYEFAGAGGMEKAVRGAPSAGAFFNANIRGKFAATQF